MKTKADISIIAFLFAAAWICQFRTYIPVSEDYMLALWYQDGLFLKIQEIYEKTGIRRSFGLLSNAPLCASPEWLTNYILLAMHFTVTILVYAVSKLLSRSGVIGLFCALVVGILPWGYGAVTYACGSYTIPHSAMFLGGLLILLRYALGQTSSQWLAIGLSSLCYFGSCITGEHYVFAISLTGVLALCATNEHISPRTLLRPYVLAPAFVSLFYILAVYATQSGQGLMSAKWEESSLLETFNPKTLVSVWLYQWRNFLFFQPLFNLKSTSTALADMGVVRIALGSVFFVIACLFCVFRAKTLSHAASACKNSRAQRSLLVMLLIMLSVSFVHALAGGYSASSRHQYVPIVIGLLFSATLLASVTNIEKKLLAKHGIPFIIGCGLAVLSTWVIVGINRIELKRYDELCRFIGQKNFDAPIWVQLQPPLNYLWPGMAKTTSTVFDTEYAINWNLEYNHKRLVKIDRKARQTVIAENQGTTNKIYMTHGVKVGE